MTKYYRSYQTDLIATEDEWRKTLPEFDELLKLGSFQEMVKFGDGNRIIYTLNEKGKLVKTNFPR